MGKLGKIIGIGLIGAAFFNFNPCLTLAEQEFSPASIIDFTNQERRSSDLPELSLSSLLSKAAEMKAEDMAEHSYFAHTSPEGVTPWSWFSQSGYAYEYAGENLAINIPDSQKAVEAWMESPKHKENILDKNYTEIGVGISYGTYKGKDTVFIVQFFGQPRNSIAPTLVKPKTKEATPSYPREANLNPVLGAKNDRWDQTLRLGSLGPEIFRLQNILNMAGYNAGVADGKFGPQTKLAVARFQQNIGLVDDGIVGPLTRAMLQL